MRLFKNIKFHLEHKMDNMRNKKRLQAKLKNREIMKH